jgi:hypothetical protein
MQTRNPLSLVLACVLIASAAQAEPLESERERLWTDYRERLGGLAAQAQAAGDGEAARILGNWLPMRERHQLLLFDASRLKTPTLEGPFAVPFRELRHEQADQLFALAERAAESGQSSLALRLATEAVREEPDHAEARRVLGYQKTEGHWATPYEARLHGSGHIWHDTYGWIKAGDLAQYEAGLRPHGRQWISAERDASIRRSIERGWVVRTEHFLISTNHSLEEGVALAGRLESLHAVWSQLFADYWIADGEVQNAFAGVAVSSRRGRPHRVSYFRTRDEYNAALRRRQPRIDITLGIYFDTERHSYFFAGEDQHPATIVHEAVHQLFQESRPTARLVGRADNFWIIEGIATYFESLARHDDPIAGPYFTLGGPGAGRLPTARARVLEEDYYVPLSELVGLGKDDLQQRPDLRQIYSQLAGLTTFFMHAEDGRYRQPLVDYLADVYTSRTDETSLARLAGQSYEQLDLQYRRFLESR